MLDQKSERVILTLLTSVVHCRSPLFVSHIDIAATFNKQVNDLWEPIRCWFYSEEERCLLIFFFSRIE